MSSMNSFWAVVVFLFLVFPGGGFAQPQWELAQEDEHITVYSRRVHESANTEFKAICVIEQPIEIIAAALFDISGYPKWFYKCREALILKRNNPGNFDFTIYVALETPWPLVDRDVIFKAKTFVDLKSGKIIIDSVALKDPLVPITKQFVRITDANNQWVLEKKSPQATHVTFSNRTNAAGSVSTYLSDLGCRKTTFHSLKNLRQFAFNSSLPEILEKMRRENKGSFSH